MTEEKMRTVTVVVRISQEQYEAFHSKVLPHLNVLVMSNGNAIRTLNLIDEEICPEIPKEDIVNNIANILDRRFEQ
jgi:hypothetical protein